MKTKTHIRLATATDVPALLALEKEASVHPFSQEIIESELAQPAARLLVAVCDEKIAGYIDFWKVLTEIDIIQIAVHPDYWGKGVAQELFHVILSEHPDAKKTHLEVRTSNIRAQKFYEKLGFCVTGERKKYYRNGEDALVMTMNL